MLHIVFAFFSLLFAVNLTAQILHLAELTGLDQSNCVPTIIAGDRVGADTIRQFKVIYQTRDHRGQMRVASGLLAFSAQKYPERQIVFYGHATAYDRKRVPSYLSRESQFAVCQFVRAGEIFLAPDFFGLGDSPGFHPFMTVTAEVLAGRSFLELMIAYLEENGFSLAQNLVMTGYSAGAHSTLALIYDLFDRPLKTAMPVTHFLSMSGPYDLVDLGKKPLFEDPKAYYSSLYGAFIVVAYQEEYGDIYQDLADIVQPGYETLEKIMRTQHGETIDDYLPKYPRQIFKSEFIHAVQTNPDHPLNRALRRNSLTARALPITIDMLYSAGDRSVLPEQSLTFVEQLNQIGVSASSQKVVRFLDHRKAYTPIVYQGAKLLRKRLVQQ